MDCEALNEETYWAAQILHCMLVLLCKDILCIFIKLQIKVVKLPYLLENLFRNLKACLKYIEGQNVKKKWGRESPIYTKKVNYSYSTLLQV